MIFGHWSSTGEMQSGNFHSDNSSNAFIINNETDQKENRFPEQLISRVMECCSYPKGWVLSKCKGIAVTEITIHTFKSGSAAVAHEF